jgi:hypothetical protein
VGFNGNIATLSVVGTVSSGVDTGGLFGPAGADLTGRPYSLVFVFDTSLGGPTESPYPNGVVGSLNSGITSPSLGATFSIGGTSRNIGGNYLGFLAWGLQTGSTQSFFYADSSYIVGATNIANNVPEDEAWLDFQTINKLPAFGTSFDYTLVPPSDFYINAGVAFGMPTLLASDSPEIIQLSDFASPLPSAVPGPVAGAGLPGLAMAVAGFIGWRRSRRALTA